MAAGIFSFGIRKIFWCSQSTRDDWWAVTDSNRRHSACKADALPTELTAPSREIYLGSMPSRNTVAAGPQGPPRLRITSPQKAPKRDNGLKM